MGAPNIKIMNKTYKIKSGDNLSKIAKQFEISLEQLLNLNPKLKANPNKINVGDLVVIGIENEDVIPQPKPVEPEKVDIELGSLSVKYEVGNRGPDTVSTGIGDAGGASYGSYQMTSKPNGGTVKRFISQEDFPFTHEFEGLIPGGKDFTLVWKRIANEDIVQFKNLQHEFIKKTHFDPLVNKVRNEKDFDLSTRSNALQNVVWSVAVQHGPGSSIIQKALDKFAPSARNDVEFDRRLIEAIYDERGRKDANGNLVYFSRNSKAVQQGVANRFINEKKDALNML